ncbi:MAG: AMP-binding protein [Immundisolibacterales bacterium]|nr:AMP-binding protein [Immundisolibacterales bacterium]
MAATSSGGAARDDWRVMLTQERIDSATAAGHWPDRTAGDYLDAGLDSHPDKVFLTGYRTETGTRQTFSYRDIDRISRRIGAGLAAHGIGKGDVVAFQLPNWWEFAALHLACVRIGAISNPLMPIFRARELEFMLSFAEPRALVIPRVFRGFEYEPMIDGLRGRLPDLAHVFVLGGEGENGFESTLIERRWEDEVDTRALFDERRVDPNEVIEICYTSGTTGQPKGVMHTSNTLAACVGIGPARLGLGSDTVVLMASPLAHQTGYLYGLLLPIRLGARTVLQDVWDPTTAARIIHDEQVTFTMGATPFLADLAHADALERYPTESLEVFITAGAPVPRVLVQTATQRLGTNVVAGWGMTENGLVTCTLAGDPPEKVFGSDGGSWDGMEVRVVDAARKPAPPGVSGDLQARGAANFVGYLKRPEAFATDDDGWFDTGDIASMDESGYIRITSRAKDIIIRGGENVPVVEVEELLYRHDAVSDASIVAMPDPRMGERGCLFVTLRPGGSLDFASMQRYLEEKQLAKQYWPERLEIIDEMPRTPSGKIQKFKLREIASGLEPDEARA